jgi:hypothetical protein
LVPAVLAVEMDLLAQTVKTLYFHPLLQQAVEVAAVIKQMVCQAVLVVVRHIVVHHRGLELLVKVLVVEMVELLVSMVLAVAVVLAQ